MKTNKKLEFTLAEYKTAVERLSSDQQPSLTRREISIMSEILRRDIAKREDRVAKQQAKLANPSLSKGPTEHQAKPSEDSKSNDDGKEAPAEPEPTNSRPNRNPVDSDKTIRHGLTNFTAGESCPKCSGSMYIHRDKVVICITCPEIVIRERHLCETARCVGCGFTKSAELPFKEDSLVHQHSPLAAANMLVLHYYLGMAFNRISALMDYFNKNYSVSSQWDVASAAFDRLLPLFSALWIYARENATNMRIDDAGAKILSLKVSRSSRARDGTERIGVNTTAMYFEMPGNQPISLFCTGLHHGGEISQAIAQQRKNIDPLVRISDAASKNFSLLHGDRFIDACCNEHAFAYFRKLKENHPESYEFVAEIYGNIFENDNYCKLNKLSAEERLKFHQKHSASEMARLRTWAEMKLTTQYIENNSDEGTAINYLANQFVKLTEFLRTPGVPLDTNRVEQFLRVSKRYFKNSSFYKTETGAEVGDLMMSLIRTAVDAKVSPIFYLQWCLENHIDLRKNPEKYFPWEYAKLNMTAKAA